MPTRKKILIIDDSDDDREVYHRHLRKDHLVDWEVFNAETGEAGVELFSTQPVHCVLLDYSLPGRDGLEILTDLRSQNAHIPVVMLTGQGSEMVAAESIVTGAQEYLSKGSITARSLQSVIHNAILRSEMAQEMDAKTQELENFASVLAHDLKQPARSIQAFLGMIAENMGDNLDEETATYFQHVNDLASRMHLLIDTIGNYALLDREPPNHEHVVFSEVIANAISNLASSLEEKNALVTHDDVPTVLGNQTQLTQLMQNLIANGIKYCNEQQPVVHISAESQNRNCRFSVKDNGIGIDEKHLRRIFEPFKRLHGISEYSGTGLGLATCKKIVERHNGQIWCESEEGDGANFYFTLPVPPLQ